MSPIKLPATIPSWVDEKEFRSLMKFNLRGEYWKFICLSRWIRFHRPSVNMNVPISESAYGAVDFHLRNKFRARCEGTSEGKPTFSFDDIKETYAELMQELSLSALD